MQLIGGDPLYCTKWMDSLSVLHQTDESFHHQHKANGLLKTDAVLGQDSCLIFLLSTMAPQQRLFADELCYVGLLGHCGRICSVIAASLTWMYFWWSLCALCYSHASYHRLFMSLLLCPLRHLSSIINSLC